MPVPADLSPLVLPPSPAYLLLPRPQPRPDYVAAKPRPAAPLLGTTSQNRLVPSWSTASLPRRRLAPHRRVVPLRRRLYQSTSDPSLGDPNLQTNSPLVPQRLPPAHLQRAAHWSSHDGLLPRGVSATSAVETPTAATQNSGQDSVGNWRPSASVPPPVCESGGEEPERGGATNGR